MHPITVTSEQLQAAERYITDDNTITVVDAVDDLDRHGPHAWGKEAQHVQNGRWDAHEWTVMLAAWRMKAAQRMAQDEQIHERTTLRMCADLAHRLDMADIALSVHPDVR